MNEQNRELIVRPYEPASQEMPEDVAMYLDTVSAQSQGLHHERSMSVDANLGERLSDTGMRLRLYDESIKALEPQLESIKQDMSDAHKIRDMLSQRYDDTVALLGEIETEIRVLADQFVNGVPTEESITAEQLAFQMSELTTKIGQLNTRRQESERREKQPANYIERVQQKQFMKSNGAPESEICAREIQKLRVKLTATRRAIRGIDSSRRPLTPDEERDRREQMYTVVEQKWQPLTAEIATLRQDVEKAGAVIDMLDARLKDCIAGFIARMSLLAERHENETSPAENVDSARAAVEAAYESEVVC